MELRRYWQIIRRWWWLLLVGPVVAGVVAYFVSESQTDIYRAETTLLVNQTQTPGTLQLNDILASERLTNTYAELVEQRPILSGVIDELDLPLSENELKSKIDVDPVTDTQLLRVKVKDPDPALATSIANALAQEFIESNESEPERFGTVSVVEPAIAPTGRVDPRVQLNTALAIVMGLLIAAGIVLILEYLDDTVKSAEDVANVGLSPLATVTRFKDGRGRKDDGKAASVVAESWRSPAAEAYRLLRTNIRFATMNQPTKVLLVTSSDPLEGKSTTAANLAVVMAQAGRRTILLDTDLRSPSLHRYFGLANDKGLTNLVLDGSRDIDIREALQETEVKNLAVIPSGPLPPNPTEVLASSRMAQLLKRAGELADVVILDSPPLRAVADASILAGEADATVLVIEASKTRTQAVRRSVEMLGRAKVRTLGAVLNKEAERDGQYPT